MTILKAHEFEFEVFPRDFGCDSNDAEDLAWKTMNNLTFDEIKRSHALLTLYVSDDFDGEMIETPLEEALSSACIKYAEGAPDSYQPWFEIAAA